MHIIPFTIALPRADVTDASESVRSALMQLLTLSIAVLRQSKSGP